MKRPGFFNKIFDKKTSKIIFGTVLVNSIFNNSSYSQTTNNLQVIDSSEIEIGTCYLVNDNSEIDALNEVFVVVEKSASFQGGDSVNFRNYIMSKLVYPDSLKNLGVSGKVIVQFTINEKGQVENPKVVRSVHPDLDKEVLRCIINSPNWIPASNNGDTIKQQFIIPITFNNK